MERVHGTHQDRLVKKLRRKEIATHEAANVYLEREYLPEHNRRFARTAARPEDYHRRAPRAAELDRIFRLENERVVSDDWVVRCDNRFFQLQRRGRHYPPTQGKVLVCEGRHGQISIEYRGRALNCQEIPAPAKPSVRAAPQEAHRAGKNVLSKRKWAPSRYHPWREPFSQAEQERQRELATRKAPSRLAWPSASP